MISSPPSKNAMSKVKRQLGKISAMYIPKVYYHKYRKKFLKKRQEKTTIQ
jgi:hypothetical protein